MSQLLPNNVGIITCDKRKLVVEATLADLRENASFVPRVFNVPRVPNVCHKGANERAIFQWGADTIPDDGWLLRLEDDVRVHPDAEQILQKLTQIPNVDVFSLGDISTRYSREFEYEGLVFRELKLPVYGIQALLIKGKHLKKIANAPTLDRPSEHKILEAIGNPVIWQLADPPVFPHKLETSVCWNYGIIPLPKICNEAGSKMSTDDNLIINLEKPIKLRQFGKRGLEEIESKSVKIRAIHDLPDENRILIELHGIDTPVVFCDDAYPRKASIRKLMGMIKNYFDNGT